MNAVPQIFLLMDCLRLVKVFQLWSTHTFFGKLRERSSLKTSSEPCLVEKAIAFGNEVLTFNCLLAFLVSGKIGPLGLALCCFDPSRPAVSKIGTNPYYLSPSPATAVMACKFKPCLILLFLLVVAVSASPTSETWQDQILPRVKILVLGKSTLA